MMCPCKDCLDRVVDVENGTNCHSTCKRYLEWQGSENVRKKQREDALKYERGISSFKTDMVRKAMRRQGMY